LAFRIKVCFQKNATRKSPKLKIVGKRLGRTYRKKVAMKSGRERLFEGKAGNMGNSNRHFAGSLAAADYPLRSGRYL